MLPSTTHLSSGRYIQPHRQYPHFLHSKYAYALIGIENTGAKKVYGPFNVSAGESAEIENPDMSGSIDPDMLLSSAENAIRSNEQINKTASIDGVITYSNKKNSNAGISNSGRDMYSNYTKTATETSNSRNTVLASVKNAESAGAVKVASYVTSVKIPVTKDGLYFLPASKIASVMRSNEQAVKSYIKYNVFSLTNQGQAVAYSHDDSGTGILFYGRGMKSIYTDENIYWLSYGQGLPMGNITGRLLPLLQETIHLPRLSMLKKTILWFRPCLMTLKQTTGSGM